MRLELALGVWALITCAAFAADKVPGSLSPTEEKASFRLADAALDIELVAAEPDINSPVAIAWDTQGRMYVAEMSDYPNSRDKGRIKRLEDQDGDGRYEGVRVFADQLPFPTGVLPWKDGVLVTAAPDIWFLSDTNTDGVADERRKILSGFAEGNQQLRVNGLTWGLDNWIYIANGRSDGEIRWADQANSAVVPLRGHDLRFRPDTHDMEAIAGRSQFGLARDDWGNRFLSWNTIPIRHEVLPERYLNRNQFLAATESVLDILEPGDTGQVFPLTPSPLTFNNESTTHFNALAGLTIFRGDALGGNYRGNAFVGESLRNLVHRRALDPSGPTFVARRVERDKEFLASTDPWFHPVNFATGPDGGLYVVDFYRQWVEHPDFVRGPARHEVPWQTGAEHGRIWRVAQKNGMPHRGKVRLHRASSAELAKQLENPIGWWRDNAQRLLVERKDPAAGPILRKIAQGSTMPEARVHALYALAGSGALELDSLETALKDRHPRVRAAGLQLTAGLMRPESVLSQRFLNSLRSLGSDNDSNVRFQLALALGDMHGAWKPSLLARLAERDHRSKWHSAALLSSLGESPWPFLREVSTEFPLWLKKPTPEQARLLDQVSSVIGANHSRQEGKEFMDLVTERTTTRLAQFSLFAGFLDGMARASSSEMPEAIRGAPRIVNHVSKAVVEQQSQLETRLAALRILVRRFSATGEGELPKIIPDLLKSDPASEIQAAAATAFGQVDDRPLAESVFSHWNSYALGIRKKLASAALRTRSGTGALVSALEEGQVSTMELDASVRQALLNDAGSKVRITELFRTLATTNRDALIREFQPALSLTGDPRRGAAMFERLCLACHAIGAEGNPVGPDIRGIAARPAEALLADILDPNRVVPPEYVAYSITTARDETLSGLILGENATSVTLRRQGQADETILRKQIKLLRAEGKSLMPEGLEGGLSKQDMADLLQFLRAMDPALLRGK